MTQMALRNLDDLVVFVHVVERQSFSATARDLHLAPKTVSKQIARLEQALGTTLFERNTRNLRITGEGRAIAERARVALSVLEEVQELATGASQELSGTIRLTAPTPFGRKFVAPAIHDFCRLHPRVGFDLRLSDQVQDLYSGDLDLAIRMGELADSRLVARRVADNRRILAASPAYLKAHGTPAIPHDLTRHQCIVLRQNEATYGLWRFTKGRRSETVKVRGNLSSNDGEVTLTWGLAGLGILQRAEWDLARYLRSGRLVRVLEDYALRQADIYAVFPERHHLSAKVRVFVDFLVGYFQKGSENSW
ncbi:MAG TPA: LysR family transcriptional regulator [Achromobacter sp.]|nr:LysR family transcriptional regulator [Achromobacter sp.]